MSVALGIDIGGTFTDLVVHNPDTREVFAHKQLTTPDDPIQGVLQGIEELVRRKNLDVGKVTRVVHATTLFTNLVIERRGAKTGVLVTAGFRDMFEMRRENRHDLYDLQIQLPAPIVSRSLCSEIGERMSSDGSVITPLNLADVDSAADRLVEQGVESIAIVFLHSYVNSAHERAAATSIKARHPSIAVSASYQVAPEIREFERGSTTVVNAYIKPLAERYLARFAGGLESAGIRASLFLMLSNGGLTDLSEATRVPVQLLESGPAAGALAASHFARQSGTNDVLALDVGGTTAKLALIENGRPVVAYSFEAAREQRFVAGSGHPIKISTVELIEIGAGGGSIASVDALGLLKAGPASAGAVPGPACYGRGGTDPTVTDANLILGLLDPNFFAGGSLPLHNSSAEGALKTLEKKSGLRLPQVAWGIHNIANENMANAARIHASERDKDTRQQTLIVTGGGGPIHGPALARKLGISRILCPRWAGVASALGLLLAPARADRVMTLAMPLDGINLDMLEEAFLRLEQDAKNTISRAGADRTRVQVQRAADMRYVGQGFEVFVPLPSGFHLDDGRKAIRNAFESSYAAIFSRPLSSGAIEIINIRVTVEAEHDRSATSLVIHNVQQNRTLAASIKGKRLVQQSSTGTFEEVTVYDRALLPNDLTIKGPALIEEPESTLVIDESSEFHQDEFGNLLIDRMENISDSGTANVGESGLDPVSTEVLYRRLLTAADEASAALKRTAFSTVLRESDDYSFVLTDAKGRLLAQATKSIPSFIGSLPITVKAFLDKFGQSIDPDDVLITNDPWIATGHLFDISIAKPIFYKSNLIGFAACTAHAADIGGSSDAHSVTDIFEEGLRIPILKLFKGGVIDEVVLDFIRSNVRIPDQVLGDLMAQVNGLNLIEARVHSCVVEFGLDDLSGVTEELCARGERSMREAIRRIPDGVYRYEFDTDGGIAPIHITTKVVVDGSSVAVDFTGSSGQVRGSINVPFPYTYAMSCYALKCLAPAELPNNEGTFRPIKVTAPPGSILNSIFPSSGGQRVCTGHYIPHALLTALGSAIPNKVIAGSGSPLWSFLLRSVRNGRPHATKVFINGGMGARATSDGPNVLSWPSNVSSTPTEMIEQLAPLRLLFKRFRKGAGGIGRHRGGTGQELLFQSLSDEPLTITFNAERTRNPAPGMAGGEPGQCGEILLNGALQDSRRQLTLRKDDRVLIRTPSGGGFGAVEERDDALSASDLAEGYV